MSAGAFETGRYFCEATGEAHPIRVQPETKALSIGGTVNEYPPETVSSPISAQVSQSKRAFGVNARTVSIKFPTTPPTGYKVGSVITLPWFNPFPTPAFAKGATVSYLGATGEYVGSSSEKVN